MLVGLCWAPPLFAQQPREGKPNPNQEAELRAAQAALEQLLKQIQEKESKEPRPAPPKPTPDNMDKAAQIRQLQERLLRLQAELRELEARKAQREAGPGPQPGGAPGANPYVPNTKVPPQPGWMMVRPQENNPLESIRGLSKHADPKVAELARQLLAHLEQKQPWPQKLHLEIQGVKVPGAPVADLVVVGKGAGSAPAAAGHSSLRLSTDGKTAAVVAADGSVTIYDVATGKEVMGFPTRK
jgi:hypothetical protein